MIPYSKTYLTGNELPYLEQSIKLGHWSGDGPFTSQCIAFLEKKTGGSSFLTSSATHALELAFMALDLQPGDEVVLPSFTFVSTANSLVQLGLKPVFIDIREDTLNMDENLIEQAISKKTKAILPVHYAGVSCEMEAMIYLAKKHNLYIVEDAAQGLNAFYKNRSVGTLGDLGVFSFHQTKNITCGEGGALIARDDRFSCRIQVHRQKGTDRGRFLRGEIDKYSWIDRGSSYILSDLLAAFLYAQLEEMERITAMRESVYDYYRQSFETFASGRFQLPFIPETCRSNYHLFYILLEKQSHRDQLRAFLLKNGVEAVTHFVPLHNSLAGEKYGSIRGSMEVTDKTSRRLLRLPLYPQMTRQEQDAVILKIKSYFQCS